MLDNRETATLIWLLVLSAGVASRKNLRASVGGVFRIAMHPKVLLPIALMCGYVGMEVWIGAKLSLWQADLTKPTMIWLAVTALVMLVNFAKASEEPLFYRRTAMQAFGIAAVLQFFLNAWPMHFLAEIALQPVLAVLTMLSVYATRDEQHRSVKKAADFLIALAGFALLGYTIRQLYSTSHQINTRGMLLQLALPVWLTIGYLPFIYIVSLYANYEMAFTGINWATTDRNARWRGKIALLTKFHFRARELSRFPWIVAKQLAAAPDLSAARVVITKFQRTRRDGQPTEGMA
jgi:hypothetical protein